MFDIPDTEPTPEELAREAREESFRKSVGVMKILGYPTIQEALVDTLIEGIYNKEENTWTEITDPTDIQTNRNHMNLAQAKYYGLKIIRLGDFIDNSNVKSA